MFLIRWVMVVIFQTMIPGFILASVQLYGSNRLDSPLLSIHVFSSYWINSNAGVIWGAVNIVPTSTYSSHHLKLCGTRGCESHKYFCSFRMAFD